MKSTARKRKVRRTSKGRAGPVTLDPELLGHLLDAFEGLWTLRRRATQVLANEKEDDKTFGHLRRLKGHPSAERWEYLVECVTACWSPVEQCVRRGRINPAQLQLVYHQMLWVQATWSSFAPQQVPRDLIRHIIDSLRQVLVACASHWKIAKGGA